MLSQQNYRCAGCGLKLNNVYAKRCRLCYYYNELFCQCCHQGAKRRIPARILYYWNFRHVGPGTHAVHRESRRTGTPVKEFHRARHIVTATIEMTRIAPQTISNAWLEMTSKSTS